MVAIQESGMQLQRWAIAHEPAEDLIYKNGYWEQIIFVRDRIAGLIAQTMEEYQAIQDKMMVISEHTSKSVCLPVFRLELVDGTVFTMRYNFHDWKVSVSSSCDVDVDFMGLFNPSEQIKAVYCEGFPRELVYGPYSENKRQFTVELPSGEHHLFTFFYLFAYQVLGSQSKDGNGA